MHIPNLENIIFQFLWDSNNGFIKNDVMAGTENMAALIHKSYFI